MITAILICSLVLLRIILNDFLLVLNCRCIYEFLSLPLADHVVELGGLFKSLLEQSCVLSILKADCELLKTTLAL